MAKIHDLFIIELAEVIKGYGNDPDVEDPFRLSEFYRFYELPNIAVSRENFEKMRPAQPEQRWIPVSERMPDPRIDVWCNSDMGQMVGYYDEYAETWYGRDYLELIVTAWMPLPEPYRPEGSRDENKT